MNNPANQETPSITTPMRQAAHDNGRRLPSTLPILPLRGIVVYPLTAVPINVGQPRSIHLVDAAAEKDGLIGLCTSHNPELSAPGPSEIYRVGALAVIHRQLRKSDGTIRLLVNGLKRIRIREFVETEPYLVAAVESWPESIETGAEAEAMARHLVEMFLHLAQLVPSIPGNLLASSLSSEDPLQTVYTIANYLHLDLHRAQELLEIDSLTDKMVWLLRTIGKEVEIMEMGQRIRSEAFGQMEQAQREYFLREQLKAIQRELGEADERTLEVQTFRQKLETADLPHEARQEAERELARLSRLPVAAAEYGVVRTYLEWLTGLPWNRQTTDNLDLRHARQVLDEDHHGLIDIKERIVEFLAVRRLRRLRASAHHESQPRPNGAILCFVGPPGVGKTSLGRSIARAMGREFARISLGGARDEAEIRGHRRTYVGALPGRIIQTLKRTQSKNPVIVLDEVDKIGADFRGDPAAALLELLDPQQNSEFHDHYLDVPFDLSDVLFITTANTIDPIAPPLRDRMEIIRLSGYTESEKSAIAAGYLAPRQIVENGLRPSELHLPPETLCRIIHSYTREAGVRELERLIGQICRKVATHVAANTADPTQVAPTIVITPDTLESHLGPPRFFAEIAARTQTPGVAVGLSWTSAGGAILFIEAAKMSGGKNLILTGQLGDVMKESAQAALTYIRAQADRLHVDPRFFDRHDIHIHVPAGAIPKDGPSAGVTIATALASLLSDQPVHAHVGMTGEITLRGQLMPVGGIKEKVLAAHHAGLKTIVLPRRNEQDLVKIPEEIRDTLQFIFADTIDDALNVALSANNT